MPTSSPSPPSTGQSRRAATAAASRGPEPRAGAASVAATTSGPDASADPQIGTVRGIEAADVATTTPVAGVPAAGTLLGIGSVGASRRRDRDALSAGADDGCDRVGTAVGPGNTPSTDRDDRCRRDPVGTALGLRGAVAARIATILEAGDATAETRATPAPEGGRQIHREGGVARAVGDVYVGWHAALDVRTCPARYRGQGEDVWGFPGWSPPIAAASVGRASLDHHLRVHERSHAMPGWPADPAPLPAPLDVVRAWMRAMRTGADCPVGGWAAERWAQEDDAVLAATAAGAARWIAGFVRVVGWPLPAELTLFSPVRAPDAAAPLRWRPERGSSVTVASGADARWGRVTGSGDFALAVHRVGTGDDERLRDRAAFEAAAGALAIGVRPAEILLTAGDTGERLRVAVTDELLDLGADMTAAVVEQRVVALTRGHDPADASPSPACRHCPHLDTCDPGQAWLTGPGRWRGGLPTW